MNENMDSPVIDELADAFAGAITASVKTDTKDIYGTVMQQLSKKVVRKVRKMSQIFESVTKEYPIGSEVVDLKVTRYNTVYKVTGYDPFNNAVLLADNQKVTQQFWMPIGVFENEMMKIDN